MGRPERVGAVLLGVLLVLGCQCFASSSTAQAPAAPLSAKPVAPARNAGGAGLLQQAVFRQTYYLPQVANGEFASGSIRTAFVIFSAASTTEIVSISLTRDDGSPLPVTVPGLGSGSEFSFELPAGATRLLSTDGRGALSAGAALVRATGPLGVSAVFSLFDRRGAFLTEAGIDSSPLLRKFAVPVDAAGSLDTGLALFNPAAEPASLTLRLKDRSGSSRGTTRLTLGGRGHLARFVAGELFPGTAGLRGTLEVSASRPVSALTLRQHPSPLSFTTLPVAPRDSPQRRFHLPQIADGTFPGGRIRTTLVLFSLATTTTTAAIDLTRNDGSPFPLNIPGLGTASAFRIELPAGGSRFLQTGGGEALVSGSAVVRSNGPIGAAAVFSIFDNNGRFLTEAGVGDSEAILQFSLPVQVSPGLDTGIALFNPQGETAAITLLLKESTTGAVVDTFEPLALEGHRRIARFASELFSGLSDFKGSVEVLSSQPIAALTLRQHQAPLALTTLPVESLFENLAVGTTDGEGVFRVIAEGVELELALVDGSSQNPLPGLAVGFAQGAGTDGAGLVVVVDPARRYPLKLVLLTSGPGGLARPAMRGSGGGQRPIVKKVIELLMLEADVIDAFPDVGLPFGLSGAVKAVNIFGSFTKLVKLLDQANVISAQRLLGTTVFPTQCVPISPDQAGEDIQRAFVSDLGKTVVLGALAGGPPGAAVGILASTVSALADRQTAVNCVDGALCVFRHPLMDLYACDEGAVPVDPLFEIRFSGTGPQEPPSSGSLRLLSKDSLGLAFVEAIDSGGNADVAAPVGRYRAQMASPGFEPAEFDITLPRQPPVVEVPLLPISGGQERFVLMVVKQGSGTGRVTSDPAGIDCGSDCTHTYERGVAVRLFANADPGSTFAGWTGNCEGAGVCELVMNNNRTAAAVFNRTAAGGGPPLEIPFPEFQGQTGCFNTSNGSSIVNAQTLIAWGGAPSGHYQWRLAAGSSFPAGTTVDADTGIFRGTGAAVQAGTHFFAMEATDGSATDSATFRFDVEAAAFCGAAVFQQSGLQRFKLPDAEAGAGYGAALFVTVGAGSGGGLLPLTWSVASGSLPAGLVLDPAAGVVWGIPSPAAANQTFQFTIRVLDATGKEAVCPTAGVCPTYEITVTP